MGIPEEISVYISLSLFSIIFLKKIKRRKVGTLYTHISMENLSLMDSACKTGESARIVGGED